ncbi:MAG: ABC transporter permease [Rhodoglobus sp.]
MSWIVGAFSEAWAELRIHRTRVLLSLIGVAISVTALTSVIGFGEIVQQAQTEGYERSLGRPATLIASPLSTADQQVDLAALNTAFDTVVERYGIRWSSRVSSGEVAVQFIDGVVPVETTVVDPDYGTMHRVALTAGSWFTDDDTGRLAPALVVNSEVWNRLGSPDLAQHPTVSLEGANPITAVIVGVTPSTSADTELTMFLLTEAYAVVSSSEERADVIPQFELWVPPTLAQQLAPLIKRDIEGALGQGWQIDVSRQDYQGSSGEDPLMPVKLLIGGVAILVLLLGALGLLNISLVTVRQRIREIGIRRSFGATAPRVFFAVMLESVVATAAAGVVGVFLAVLIVKSPVAADFIGQGISELPPFPIQAALLGFAVAVAVGALAGVLPALIAVRVKVIEAIRY